MLIILSGLPGTGKTSIARELAWETGAMHLRIDTIETTIRESGVLAGPMTDVGYRVAYALAEENLRLGRTVVADSVNPLAATRAAWRDVASRAGVAAVEIEVRCSDVAEHRRRIEARGWPSWQEVVDREYHDWDRERIVVDTAGRSVAECIRELRATMGL